MADDFFDGASALADGSAAGGDVSLGSAVHLSPAGSLDTAGLAAAITDELGGVQSRLGKLWLWRSLIWSWGGFALLAVVGTFTFGWSGVSITLLLMAAMATAAVLFGWSRSTPLNKVELARHVESAYPELNSKLLAALELAPDVETGRYNVLQRQVLSEAAHHALINDWADAVPPTTLRSAFWKQAAACVGFVVLSLCLVTTSSGSSSTITKNGTTQGLTAIPTAGELPVVEPGSVELERGSSLLVLARFAQKPPAEVEVVWWGTDGTEHRQSLNKSLDDPLFGGRLPPLKEDSKYRIEFDGRTTPTYDVDVYDLPALVQSDLELQYPAYTGLEVKKLPNAFEATVVEGTTIAIECRVNKPLASAKLIDSQDAETPLTADATNPHLYRAAYTPKGRHRLKLILTDNAGRTNRDPEEFRFEARPNRIPEIKLAFPGKDTKVSPLEEVLFEAATSDDFGVLEAGLVLTVPGRQPITVPLGKDLAATTLHKQTHLQPLEELKVEPDSLVAYHLYADDYGPDGQRRRTSTDLYFAEVRAFEEIFREMEAPSGKGASSSKQENGNPTDKLIELQKQIIVATWKIARTPQASWSDQVEDQVTVIRDSQRQAIEKLEALSERLTAPQLQPILAGIEERMNEANRFIGQTLSDEKREPLVTAANSEQAAYQGLLKLRAREHIIMKGQQSSAGGGGGSSTPKEALEQLELSDKQNRYEAEKTGSPEQTSANREELAILDRLKELAKRQEAANEKLKELEAALRTAKNEAEKEEIERQLKRLRDDQQQLLQDADELRNRMAKANQQERLADAKQQLDQTRQRMVEATEKLREGQLSQALNAGSRAERELKDLHDDFRKQTSAQFADALRTMREEARSLADREQKLGERLAGLQEDSRPSLRQGKDRQELEAEFKQQRQQTNNLVEEAKSVIEQAESAEPLLSKQLYDTVRSSRELKTDQALDATSQLLRAGLVPEAMKAEEQARAGIDQLKQGIEKAAEAVLGNEVDSLKRAKRELASLAEQLEKELAANANPSGGQTRKGDQSSPEGKPNPQGEASEGQGSPNKPGSEDKPGEEGKDNKSAGADGKSQEGSKGQSGQNGKPGENSPQGNGKGNQPGTPGDNKADTSGRGAGQGKSGEQPGQGEGSGQGKGTQPGQSPSGQSPNGQSPNGQSPAGQSSGGEGQGSSAEGQDGDQRPGNPNGQGGKRPGGLRGQSPSSASRGQPGQSSNNGASGGNSGGGPGAEGGVMTGNQFSDWNERLRDVESMVSDPQLQAEVAKVRERARSLRAEFKRHSQTPNWDVVRATVHQPMIELQKQLAEEVARRESPDSLVPVDRDPVPTRYRDLVRSYHEKLGGGQDKPVNKPKPSASKDK